MCQVTKKHIPRALSSAGRASALQAEGHRFEPYSAHHFKLCGPVVQLVRMPACHAGGRRFEPDPDRHFFFGYGKKFYEHSNEYVFCWCGSTVEQLICNQQVGGSIPSTSSIFTNQYGGIPEWLKGADCKSVS